MRHGADPAAVAATGVPPTSAVHWQGEAGSPTAVIPVLGAAPPTQQQPAPRPTGPTVGPTMYVRSNDPNSPHVTQVTSASWIADGGNTSNATDWRSIDIVEQTPSTTYDVLNPNQTQRPSMITWRPTAPDAWPTPAGVPWLNDEVPNRTQVAVIGAIAGALGIIASIITVGSFKLPGAVTTHFPDRRPGLERVAGDDRRRRGARRGPRCSRSSASGSASASPAAQPVRWSGSWPSMPRRWPTRCTSPSARPARPPW